jgi:putative ABC transport system ATP-binding protein
MGALVELRAVTREYRMGEVTVRALRGVDLEVDAGQLVVLLGPSGSGKTTLLNLVGGLDTPSAGEVRVAGEAIAGYSARRLADYRARTVGFVFQFFNLIPSLTASENVEFALALVERDRSVVRHRARDLLDRVGLGDRTDHFPAQLSGGEQQRVAIARALANTPRVLLCDEPTGNLDVDTGRQVLDVLTAAARDGQTTVLLVTHNAAIAPMGDRVLRLRDGHVERDDTNPIPTPPRELEW